MFVATTQRRMAMRQTRISEADEPCGRADLPGCLLYHFSRQALCALEEPVMPHASQHFW